MDKETTKAQARTSLIGMQSPAAQQMEQLEGSFFEWRRLAADAQQGNRPTTARVYWGMMGVAAGVLADYYEQHDRCLDAAAWADRRDRYYRRAIPYPKNRIAQNIGASID